MSCNIAFGRGERKVSMNAKGSVLKNTFLSNIVYLIFQHGCSDTKKTKCESFFLKYVNKVNLYVITFICQTT